MTNNRNNWKACLPQKGNGSSNLPHSAKNRRFDAILRQLSKMGNRLQDTARSGTRTAQLPHKEKMRNVRVNLYHRTYRIDKQGTAPLMLAVNCAGSTTYIPTGTRLQPSQWDAAHRKVINHPQAATINSVLSTFVGRAEAAVRDIMASGGVRGLTPAQVRDKIAERMQPAQATDTAVLAVMARYMANSQKLNTAEKYKFTIKRVVDWLGAQKAKRLQFQDITPEWLQAFDRYMVATSPSPNSRAIHLRNIRTIFNYALKKELTTARYPFRDYHIKTAPAQPVTLTLDQLRQLWDYRPAHEAQAYWLDIWRISFTLIGCNMADLCQLRKVANGRINYTRAKTGRLYSIKVEPTAAALIERHKGRKTLLDILDRYKSIRVATGSANKMLKEISSALGFPPLTMYTARYTWATIAASQDVSIEVISQALGHSYGMAVTLGYILPDRRKVDEANNKLLALLTT